MREREREIESAVGASEGPLEAEHAHPHTTYRELMKLRVASDDLSVDHPVVPRPLSALPRALPLGVCGPASSGRLDLSHQILMMG